MLGRLRSLRLVFSRARDRLGVGGGFNTYGYVNSQPTVLVDPAGLNPLIGAPAGPVGIGIGVVVTGAILASTPAGRQSLLDAANKVKDFCTSSSRDDRKDQCVKDYEVDVQLCSVAYIGWGKRGYAQCMTAAGERLGRCMASADGR
jgi:hypothetical protein